MSRIGNTVLGCNLKNDRMISVRLQGKPFNITVIQIDAPTSNAEEGFLISPCLDDHYIYYCGQGSLRRNGVAIMVNRRVRNAVLGCSLKKDRMISVHLQGKPFNITVIQVYAPKSNAEEAEVERFYEDLQNLLELTHKKDVLFIIGD